MAMDKKLKHLKKLIREMGSVLVAYSGGLDSSFLLKVAKDCLGDKVLAVTAVSETYTKKELEFAKSFCQQYYIRHKTIRTHELSDKNFSSNPKERCYFCKKELFQRLKAMAKRSGIKNIIDATNADDRSDYRPGAKAKEEAGVLSPLDQAGMTKIEIRSLSKKMNLPSWDKPQMACLASRIRYGSRITKQRLRRIERAEDFLRQGLGITGNIRVRDFGESARIEVDKKNVPFLIKSDNFVIKLRQFGFENVTVDSQGYRTGSMNKE
jgi:uncharacterized protein